MQLSNAMGRKRSTGSFPNISFGNRLTMTSPHPGMGCPSSLLLNRSQSWDASSSARVFQTSGGM
eukprot:1497731-Alexandrium_andersonii.AAC.1